MTFVAGPGREEPAPAGPGPPRQGRARPGSRRGFRGADGGAGAWRGSGAPVGLRDPVVGRGPAVPRAGVLHPVPATPGRPAVPRAQAARSATSPPGPLRSRRPARGGSARAGGRVDLLGQAAICGSLRCRARSASLIMPTRRLSSTTGSRRIWWPCISRSTSSTSAPASIQRGVPCAMSPAVTFDGSCPTATQPTTMSRSVRMPHRRSSASAIGRAPTFSSRISCAARSRVSCAGIHCAPGCMMSFAVVIGSASCVLRRIVPRAPAILDGPSGVRDPWTRREPAGPGPDGTRPDRWTRRAPGRTLGRRGTRPPRRASLRVRAPERPCAVRRTRPPLCDEGSRPCP